MKKKLALLLACTMALGLTACGGSKPAAAPETTAAATEAAAESSEESIRKKIPQTDNICILSHMHSYEKEKSKHFRYYNMRPSRSCVTAKYKRFRAKTSLWETSSY